MPERSQLAALLRTVYAAQLVLALAWCAWRWSVSPAQAMVGALLILFQGALVLVAEFIVVARLSRTDSVPAPTAADLARAWWAEFGAFLRVFYWRQAWR